MKHSTIVGIYKPYKDDDDPIVHYVDADTSDEAIDAFEREFDARTLAAFEGRHIDLKQFKV